MEDIRGFTRPYTFPINAVPSTSGVLIEERMI